MGVTFVQPGWDIYILSISVSSASMQLGRPRRTRLQQYPLPITYLLRREPKGDGDKSDKAVKFRHSLFGESDKESQTRLPGGPHDHNLDQHTSNELFSKHSQARSWPARSRLFLLARILDAQKTARCHEQGVAISCSQVQSPLSPYREIGPPH
jgi:hypothetical protein